MPNEIQKHLQLYDLSLGEYLVNKYALWLDFRMTDESYTEWAGEWKIEKKKNQLGLLMLTFT